MKKYVLDKFLVGHYTNIMTFGGPETPQKSAKMLMNFFQLKSYILHFDIFMFVQTREFWYAVVKMVIIFLNDVDDEYEICYSPTLDPAQLMFSNATTKKKKKTKTKTKKNIFFSYFHRAFTELS